MEKGLEEKIKPGEGETAVVGNYVIIIIPQEISSVKGAGMNADCLCGEICFSPGHSSFGGYVSLRFYRQYSPLQASLCDF